YAYSAALMAVALAALVLGLWRGWTDARRAALGLMAGVAAKVFLVDMAGLDGLLRVASFLGLGLALVGIGLLYQRLAGRPQPEDGGGA
ncbi:MAG: DUF2339 domain-containing protein, partial [Rhodobacterales bacterium]|nr:DUF2339 domain-containing protein [Rhodobacterales bacterium]